MNNDVTAQQEAPKKKKAVYINSAGKLRYAISKEELLAAQLIAKTEVQAARLLGVAFTTYKKYAVKYGLYCKVSTRPKVKEKTERVEIPPGERGKFKISKILTNQFPGYPLPTLLKRLLIHKKIAPVCKKCGYESKDIAEIGRHPLVLRQIDGNPKNYLPSNLEVCCMNCYFSLYGNPHRPRTRKPSVKRVAPSVVVTVVSDVAEPNTPEEQKKVDTTIAIEQILAQRAEQAKE